MTSLHAHLDSARALPPDYFWHRHRARLALALLSPGTRTALDYGCGTGDFARALSREVAHAWAYDADAYGREALSAELSAGTVRWLEEPRAAADTFDFVAAMDVLEHCADDAAEARELAALLRPGGTAFVTVPAGRELWSDWDEKLGHHRRYDAAGLRSALEGGGLRVTRVSHFFSYLLPAARRRARRPAVGAEFPRVGRGVNAALQALGAAERRWLGRADISMGTSLFAVAVRPV